jgi:hypothetical protein
MVFLYKGDYLTVLEEKGFTIRGIAEELDNVHLFQIDICMRNI